jgi:hypothetical protein
MEKNNNNLRKPTEEFKNLNDNGLQKAVYKKLTAVLSSSDIEKQLVKTEVKYKILNEKGCFEDHAVLPEEMKASPYFYLTSDYWISVNFPYGWEFKVSYISSPHGFLERRNKWIFFTLYKTPQGLDGRSQFSFKEIAKVIRFDSMEKYFNHFSEKNDEREV